LERKRGEIEREKQQGFFEKKSEEKGTESRNYEEKNRGDIDREERFREKQTAQPGNLNSKKNKKEAGENRGRKGRRKRWSRKLTRKTETRRGDRRREGKIGRANQREEKKTQTLVSLRRGEEAQPLSQSFPVAATATFNHH